MCLALLRHLAFYGSLSGFVKEPHQLLMPPYPVTGMHLQFDPVFFSGITEHLWDYRLQDILKKEKSDLPINPRDLRRDACRFSIDKFGHEDTLIEDLIRWHARCEEMAYPKGAKPVVIIIDIEPDANLEWLRELPRDYKGYPVRYRRSSVAIANYGAGSKIGAQGGIIGTLGGVLEDQVTRQQFGVTCAHVTGGLPSTVIGSLEDNGRLKHIIGAVVTSTLPSTGSPCNLHASPGGGVDASLIELTAVPSPPLSSSATIAPISEIDQDDLVVFEGGESRHVDARVAAATIWKKVLIGSSEYCFGDIFSLSSRKPAYLLSSVSRAGDSGAWIFEDGAPHMAVSRWLGMLVAGDRMQNQSLACYGEHVFKWARSWRSSLALT